MNLTEEIKKYGAEDVELTQLRDYDLILFDLQNRIQSIYDQGIESVKGRVIMDAAFVSVQVITEQAEKLINTSK